jgi:hypothetical protein
MAGLLGRIRQALVTDVNAPTVWLTAVFALVDIALGALVAVVTGLDDVARPTSAVTALT